MDTFDTKLSHALRNLDDPLPAANNSSLGKPSNSQASAKTAWKNLLKMPDVSPKSKAKSVVAGATDSSKRRLGVHRISLMAEELLNADSLQKSDLGPHANEKQMPSWLVKVLESDGEITTMNRLAENGKLKTVKVCVNQAAGILPVLRQLLDQDPYTNYAYLCHPSVRHVSKLKKEGVSGINTQDIH
jgi:hypothetical protein